MLATVRAAPSTPHNGCSDIPEIGHKLGISEERWNAFHSKAKILIIDDELSTAERVYHGLKDLYAEVTFCCNPKAAIDYIKAEKARGEPYTAIVCDLYMPGLQGPELLKSLGEDAPATIVHSHTMPAPAWIDISSQITEFTGRNAQALFADHLVSCKAVSIPAVPILFQHKFENNWLSKLVDRIDYVQLLDQQDRSQLAKFIENYLPDMISLDLPKELLHRFSEKIRNFGIKIQFICKYLEDECDVKSIETWPQASAEALKNADKCANLSFHVLSSSIATQNRSQLHSALQWISNLDLDNIGLILPNTLCKATHEILEEWRLAHTTCNLELNKIFQDFQAFYREDFDLNKFIKDALIAVADPQSFSYMSRTPVVVKDPERQLRSFLTKLAQSLTSRQSNHSDASTFLYCDFITTANIKTHPTKGVADALKKRGFGSCFEISYADKANQDFESDPCLIDLWPELTSLAMKTEPSIYCCIVKSENAQQRLLLFVKTSSASTDTEEKLDNHLLHSNILEISKNAKSSEFKKGANKDRTISVLELADQSKQIISLEEFIIDSYRSMSSEIDRRPIILLGEDNIIISNSYGNGHLSAATNVVHYFSHLDTEHGLPPKDPSDISFRARSLYRSAIRALQPAESNQIILAMEAQDPDFEQVKSLLMQLGFKAKDIVADHSKFDFSPN